MVQKTPTSINADLGEGCANDEALLQTVTHANVACGVHAGDAMTMLRTCRLAKQYGVAIGAHPSYPDREGFGRKSMDLPADEISAVVAQQIGALIGVARLADSVVTHIKPHGALYNDANDDMERARAIARGIAAVDRQLVVFGMAGSCVEEACKDLGLRYIREAFPDRAYTSNGRLASRSLPGAVLHDPAAIAERAVVMVRDGRVTSHDGREIAIFAQTLCIHGDEPGAAAVAKAVSSALSQLRG